MGKPSSRTRGGLEPASSGLQRVVADAFHRVPAEEAPLLAWPLACGSVVADRTRAVKFEDGILRVEVPDAAWREQLKSLAPQYISTLNQYVGRRIKGISFVVAKAA